MLDNLCCFYFFNLYIMFVCFESCNTLKILLYTRYQCFCFQITQFFIHKYFVFLYIVLQCIIVAQLLLKSCFAVENIMHIILSKGRLIVHISHIIVPIANAYNKIYIMNINIVTIYCMAKTKKPSDIKDTKGDGQFAWRNLNSEGVSL